MSRPPKNFGFKIIHIEEKSRIKAGCGTQDNFNAHVRQAKKDFAEYTEKENDKIPTI